MRLYSHERIPALDGLRGLAILLVIYYHAMRVISDNGHINNRLLSFTDSWNIGVDLFFVLSGYLITNILLINRESTNYYRAFYWRRFLRIVPLYYLTIVLLAFIVPGEIRLDNSPWFFLFFTNLYFFVSPVHVIVAPLWSIALEEQFYLVWPFIAKNLTHSLLTYSVIILFVSQPVLRSLFVEDIYFNPLTRLDGLLAGAFVALNWSRLNRYFYGVHRVNVLAAVCTIFVIVRGLFPEYRIGSSSLLVNSLDFTLVSLCFAILLSCAIAQVGRLNQLLKSRVLVSFGVHSYALYLFHMIVAYYVARAGIVPVRASALESVLTSIGWSSGVVALTWVVAKLTWRFIEAPSLQHKDRIRYSQLPAAEGTLHPVNA